MEQTKFSKEQIKDMRNILLFFDKEYDFSKCKSKKELKESKLDYADDVTTTFDMMEYILGAGWTSLSPTNLLQQLLDFKNNKKYIFALNTLCMDMKN